MGLWVKKKNHNCKFKSEKKTLFIVKYPPFPETSNSFECSCLKHTKDKEWNERHGRGHGLHPKIKAMSLHTSFTFLKLVRRRENSAPRTFVDFSIGFLCYLVNGPSLLVLQHCSVCYCAVCKSICECPCRKEWDGRRGERLASSLALVWWLFLPLSLSPSRSVSLCNGCAVWMNESSSTQRNSQCLVIHTSLRDSFVCLKPHCSYSEEEQVI